VSSGTGCHSHWLRDSVPATIIHQHQLMTGYASLPPLRFNAQFSRWTWLSHLPMVIFHLFQCRWEPFWIIDTVFHGPVVLPVTQSTASKHWRKRGCFLVVFRHVWVTWWIVQVYFHWTGVLREIVCASAVWFSKLSHGTKNVCHMLSRLLFNWNIVCWSSVGPGPLVWRSLSAATILRLWPSQHVTSVMFVVFLIAGGRQIEEEQT